MKESVKRIFEELFARYPVLEGQRASIARAYDILKTCYDGGGKLMIAGNGGSCADSGHIVGELMKGFIKPRHVSGSFRSRLIETAGEEGERLADTLQCALPALDLTGNTPLSTAYSNDVAGGAGVAQQLFGYGREGDVFLGISTSGNSGNILAAVSVASAMGIKTIGLTGRGGGKLAERADCSVIVPETETFKIQELHLPIYHALCLMLEETYF